ncbi:MAG: DNA-binding transcriptional LysR family regulator [Myxococcota bacterium]|jgi:DNA-binding transcriptional LysR family regulator
MIDVRNPFAGLNLNLFVVMHALLRHQSARLAAKEFGVTASAVSHTLRELRATFDDPLIVRMGHGLAPTSRALALAAPLREAPALLANTIQVTDRFEPTASTRRVVIATSDDAGPTVIRGFAARPRDGSGASNGVGYSGPWHVVDRPARTGRS